MFTRTGLGQTGVEYIEGGDLQGLYTQFLGYWQQIRDSITALLHLGPDLADLQSRWEAVGQAADAAGNADVREQADAAQARIAQLQEQYNPVAAKISQYLPTWLQIERDSSTQLSGLGVAIVIGPVVLVAAIAALAWVLTYGMGYLKQYYSERAVLQGVESQQLTVQQATELGYTVAPAPTLFGSLTGIPMWVWLGAAAVGLVLVMGRR